MKDRNIIRMNNKKDTREFPEVVEILREDIIIPDTVMKKANLAFDAIKAEQAEQQKRSQEVQAMKKQSAETQGNERETKKKSLSWKKIAVFAAAAALTVGGVSAGASAYMKWSRGFSEGMRATEEQKIKAEETKLAAPVNQTAEVNGIKVTAVQSLVDSHSVLLSFKVDGYKDICPEGEMPRFQESQVWIDGCNPFEAEALQTEKFDSEDVFSLAAGVYDGYVMGEDGVPINAEDGTTMLEAMDAGTYNCFMEDGSFEWQVTLSNIGTEGVFFDKPIRIELKNLEVGSYSGESAAVVEGTWAFEWTLSGNEERKSYVLDAELGDSGAKVIRAEISPVSISVTYEGAYHRERPFLNGVKMKDGTQYTYIGEGRATSISDGEGRITEFLTLDRILEIDEVESLIFVNAPRGAWIKYSEEDFCIVPLEA